jgi:hypothetical protein
MKTRAVILYLILTALQPLVAQVQIPNKCYIHFRGTINDSIPATLHLVKIDDSLYASLTIATSEIPVGLHGRITRGNLFWLARDYSDDASVMTGKFITGKEMFGKTDLGNGSIPGEGFLEFTESYPEGSLPMQVYYQEENKSLIEKTLSPRASIIQCLVIPTLSASSVISDTIRILMMERFSGRDCQDADPDQVLEKVRQVFFTNYISSNTDIYSNFPDSPTLNWELLKSMQILYNDNYILSFGVLNYAFTGGAHGMETREFTVLDTRTGKQVYLSDIFRDDYEKELTELLTRTLKTVMGIDPAQKLMENGFFVDEVKPTGNFYLTASGISFFYNHYEIAPYASGPNEIFLSYSVISSLLRPDSLVARFTQ